MKKSILDELRKHVIDKIHDEVIDNDNVGDWHHHCFNEDYYIIGYYEAEQWLKQHNVSAFEAMDYINEGADLHFGTTENLYSESGINAERVVNLLVYFAGYDVLPDVDNVDDLKQEIEDAIG